MNLNDAKIGDDFTILNIDADSQLKNRFYSLGITKGSTASVIEVTLAKETIELKLNKSRIALRISEAKCIEIEKC